MVANRLRKLVTGFTGHNEPGTTEVWSDKTTGAQKFNTDGTLGSFLRVKKIPITRVASTAEQDTLVDLPAKSLVQAVYIEVVTAEVTGTTKTILVGTLSSESGGDADGFIVGVSVASTGIKIPSLVNGAVTVGALSKETITDSGAATSAVRVPYATTANTAKSISYTLASNNWAEFVGNIVIVYQDL
jgi:hypothetical protein